MVGVDDDRRVTISIPLVSFCAKTAQTIVAGLTSVTGANENVVDVTRLLLVFGLSVG
jgi:hypothetical protein